MRGDWQHVYTGRQFWPMEPRIGDLDLRDVAHALSLQCRFGGHCRHHYSVAQHSLLVLSLWAEVTDDALGKDPSPKEGLAALLHDASEAYLVDVPQPVKPYLEGYHTAEERLMELIAKRWGFDWPPPDWVKRADAMALAIEKQCLFGHEPAPWKEMPRPPTRLLGIVGAKAFHPELVEEEYLDKLYRYLDQAGVKP